MKSVGSEKQNYQQRRFGENAIDFSGALILFILERFKMFLYQNKNKHTILLIHSFIHSIKVRLVLGRNFGYLALFWALPPDSRVKLAIPRWWNFPKVMGRQGILEPRSISSKGTLKLSESTEIMGSFFPHLLFTNILTHSRKKDVVGQLLQIGFSLMALLEAYKWQEAFAA